jgi:protein TonB
MTVTSATLHRRRLGIMVACIVVLHALALWGMQQALQRLLLKPLEAPPPMSLRLIVLSAPPPVSQPVAQPQPVDRPTRKPAKPSKPVTQRTPQAEPRPVPQAELQPQPVLEQAPSASIDEPVEAASGAPSSTPAGPPVSAVAAIPTAVAPSSDAQCLGNPKPPYPASSKRLGETGKVSVNLLIGADGRVREVSLQHSSGHPRLDGAALQAAFYWRCQPVMHDGVPQTEWRNVSIGFTLQ